MLKRKTSQTIEFDDLPQPGGKCPEWSSVVLPPLITQKKAELMEHMYILIIEQIDKRKIAKGWGGQTSSQDM